jgi:hypothetical protein
LAGWVRVVLESKDIVLVRLKVQIKVHVVRILGSPEGGVECNLLHILVMVEVSWFVPDIGGGGSLARR